MQTSKEMKPEATGRVFYGWWMVLSCGLIGLYIGGVSAYGLTVFVNPLVDEFGWSYAQISLAVSIYCLIMGLTAPVVGTLADRFGSRKMAFSGALLVGLGLLLLSRTNSLATFYGSFVVVTIGCTLCGSVVLTTAVANWFQRRVSLAMGLTTTGYGMGGLLVPVMAWLISQYQWRMTVVILAIGTWALIPALTLVIRHRPEQYGYLPDGAHHLPAPEPKEGEIRTSGLPEVVFTVRQAMRTRTFWILALAVAAQFMGLNATVLHIVPYLSSVGMATAQAAGVATALPLLSIAGRLGFGWLGDKWTKKYVLAFTLSLQVIGLIAFLYAPSLWSLIAFAAAFGTGYGGSIAVSPALTREYFGRKSFGSINGLITGVTTIAAMVGPVFTGWIFDIRGSYHWAWLTFTTAYAIAIVPVLTLKKEGQGKIYP